MASPAKESSVHVTRCTPARKHAREKNVPRPHIVHTHRTLQHAHLPPLHTAFAHNISRQTKWEWPSSVSGCGWWLWRCGVVCVKQSLTTCLNIDISYYMVQSHPTTTPPPPPPENKNILQMHALTCTLLAKFLSHNSPRLSH